MEVSEDGTWSIALSDEQQEMMEKAQKEGKTIRIFAPDKLPIRLGEDLIQYLKARHHEFFREKAVAGS